MARSSLHLWVNTLTEDQYRALRAVHFGRVNYTPEKAQIWTPTTQTPIPVRSFVVLARRGLIDTSNGKPTLTKLGREIMLTKQKRMADSAGSAADPGKKRTSSSRRRPKPGPVPQ